jgi:hypothetical protein
MNAVRDARMLDDDSLARQSFNNSAARRAEASGIMTERCLLAMHVKGVLGHDTILVPAFLRRESMQTGIPLLFGVCRQGDARKSACDSDRGGEVPLQAR